MELPLKGLGIAHPPHRLSVEEGTDLAKTICCETDKQRRVVAAIYRRSGVQNRYTCVPHRRAFDWVKLDDAGQRAEPSPGPTTNERMALYEQHAAELAIRACREALRESCSEAATITLLITVTCTGFSGPGVDVSLIRELSLPPTTQRVQVGFMGCHGAVNGLRVAQGLAADPGNRVLLCAVELCSLHYRYQWDPVGVVGNALFADGAAAIVAGGQHDEHSICRLATTGSCLIPDSTADLTWRIGDHGFAMNLGVRIPDIIRDHLRPWLETWLSENGYDVEAINSWAVHPGGPRVVSAVEQALSLPKEATAVSREILAQYGNMSSPTMLFILNQLRSASSYLPCVALGFGPGMVAEAALLV